MCARDQKWAVKKSTQSSSTRKEKYPMERKEKHLTKERETTDRRKGKQLIEGERNIL